MKDAIEVFNRWAEINKDRGMEEGHANAVNEMLDYALKERDEINHGKVIENPLCINASGIDGAPQMIANARGRGGDEEYILGNIDEYEPAQGYDLIHSMEVLYYLEDPASILKKIANSWLNESGRLIVGIDLYYENSDSHSWEEKRQNGSIFLGKQVLMM